MQDLRLGRASNAWPTTTDTNKIAHLAQRYDDECNAATAWSFTESTRPSVHLIKKHDAALYLSTDQVLNIFRKAIRSDDGNAFVLVSDFFVVVLPTT